MSFCLLFCCWNLVRANNAIWNMYRLLPIVANANKLVLSSYLTCYVFYWLIFGRCLLHSQGTMQCSFWVDYSTVAYWSESCDKEWVVYSTVAYWSDSCDKEQVITSHVSHMFWWQVISWIAVSHDILAVRIGNWRMLPSPPPPRPVH